MILVWLIVLLLAGGVVAGLVGRWSPLLSRLISLVVLLAAFVGTLRFWCINAGKCSVVPKGTWLAEFRHEWIPDFGISFHFALDGLSLVLLLLTFFLGILSVGCSWREIHEKVGFFHFNLLWVLAGITGVFLSMDLFLFYFFWEMMLIPMYLLIVVWGHENRIYAAVKFFLFTQASSLLMLLAILGLYFTHAKTAGFYSFDYFDLLGTPVQGFFATLLMLGFFVAFAVKLPAFPFHTWLPDAHTEAPTAGSVILAGLLLKTGGYGLLRFTIPLFPDAAWAFAPIAMGLGAIGVVYGAIQAFAQTDLKRLVAFSSVSHLGFVLMGIFAWNELALQGVVLQMVCHGVTTGALFIIVGALYERTHTRDLARLGGLWTTVPRLSALGMFFAMASMGLPGLGNFVGEFLILLGSFQADWRLTVIATVGLVYATVYTLRMIQGAFWGPNTAGWHLSDFNLRETAILAVLAVAIVWLGVYPQPVMDAVSGSLDHLQHFVVEQPLLPR